ncbi:NADH:flavin oxidoreductase [Parahaliea sp. F7430]|uniref:NADH:flavin oxidoreductase n=1 Tax=Sediminihaliea albiluteola TaxID=2758564 RepID=A0A7W2TXB2_9GAMM|nr:NADH:flavin oxidoreductase [Sediminihaliea albiluteola]MBA6413680.1 NADH:flavin oxidoreductase [Sediminihaliea albiluteola]
MTKAKTSPFDPIQIGPLELHNRFIKSGANENMSKNGRPTKAMVKHHTDLALGGVGLTTVAYLAVTEVGRTLEDQIWLRREVLPDLQALTDSVHAAGAAISAQITHGGSFVTGLRVKGRTISASSGINAAGLLKGNILQRAMNEEDMQRVVDEFVAGAELCREAGFDAVELHMGHGYLLNQFISPLSNKRKDQYGGSAENRVRFPARVLAAVKQAVGKDLAVIAKINVADGVRGGATAEDGCITAQALEAAGADLLVLSGGRNVESTWFTFGSNMNLEEIKKVLKGQWLSTAMLSIAAKSAPKVTFKPMYFWEYSSKVRAASRVPMAYLGGLRSIEGTQQALDAGFDCVVMARPLIHDPGLVNKFKSAELTESGCTNCNACVAYIYHSDGTRCILNPPNDTSLNHIAASAN